VENNMGIIDKIKRIIQGFNKETDFIPEEEESLIEEEEQSEVASSEDEDQINGS
jgi:hypothetical protein